MFCLFFFTFFSFVVNPNTLNNLPRKASGFKVVKIGIVQKICINYEPHGVFCMNDGHLGS
jgi:hypothetical protein